MFSFDIFRFFCVVDEILEGRLKEHVTYCRLDECKAESGVYNKIYYFGSRSKHIKIEHGLNAN